MQRWEQAEQARRALDRRFTSGNLADLRQRPRGGWVKAIRTALGMSQADLSARLGTSPPAVADLERAERDGGVTLKRLERAAQELDCTLVYALVPNSTLEGAVHQQARRRAAESMGHVGRTMDLEAQGLDPAIAEELLEREARKVIQGRGLWSKR